MNLFYKLLGEIVFTGASETWSALNGDDRELMCEHAEKEKLQPLFYRCLHTALPEKYRDTFRRKFQAEASLSLRGKHAFENVCTLLKKNNFEFIPIKGADLAYRIYPDAALRHHQDWDILFPKAQCRAAAEFLEQNGWVPVSGLEVLDPGEHHYDPLIKGDFCIEPHWNLPSFGTAAPDEIWEEIHSAPENRHAFLSPEMNLLLLSAHASTADFTHLAVSKILLDAGFILKHDSIDWDKVRKLSAKWKILRPDILIGAWPEFFPEGILPEQEKNAKDAQTVRDMFRQRNRVNAHAYEKVMNQPERFSFGWLLKRLKIYRNPDNIRRKYHQPAASALQVSYYIFKDLLCKAGFFFGSLFRRNPEVIDYYRKVNEVKQIIERTARNENGTI
ncbi:MAG TPA: hypothetical protein DDZ11_11250 [Lentisphaeria bacterium]|nr:hypothetical protein [Lentisphaeria bacterium]